MATHIKNFLTSILPTKSRTNWRLTLIQNWDSIVGKLKEHIRLEKIYDDTLIVGVYDSSWLQELYMLSNVLLKTINSHLEKHPIRHLRFKHTPQKKVGSPIISSIMENATMIPASTHILTQAQLAQLEKISDQELRTHLHNYLIKLAQKKNI